MSARLILLSGAEDALRLAALRAWKEAIGGDPFDIQSFVAGDAPPNEWIASASTVPFLSERRTVIVRNVLRVGSPSDAFDKPREALSSIPESGRLILVSDDEATADHQRLQRLETIKKSWESEVEKAGGLVQKFQVEGSKAKVELIKRAEALGKKLSPNAADLLLEMTGKSFSRATEELEKAALYAGDRDSILEADLEASVVSSREYSVFKLADAILDGNAGQALAQLHTLVGSGAKAEAAAMQGIFPNLSRNLRLIWQARLFVESRSGFANPPPEVAAALPESGGIMAASEWQRNRAMAAARRLDFNRLAACLEIVARADARLKGLEPGFTPADSLSRMVLEMVQAVRGH